MGVVSSISQKPFFGRYTSVELYKEVAIGPMVFVLWRWIGRMRVRSFTRERRPPLAFPRNRSRSKRDK